MAKMGTEHADPEPNSEFEIWRLTGSRDGFGVLVFGSGFGVNFSESAHLWYQHTPYSALALVYSTSTSLQHS